MRFVMGIVRILIAVLMMIGVWVILLLVGLGVYAWVTRG